VPHIDLTRGNKTNQNTAAVPITGKQLQGSSQTPANITKINQERRNRLAKKLSQNITARPKGTPNPILTGQGKLPKSYQHPKTKNPKKNIEKDDAKTPKRKTKRARKDSKKKLETDKEYLEFLRKQTSLKFKHYIPINPDTIRVTWENLAISVNGINGNKIFCTLDSNTFMKFIDDNIGPMVLKIISTFIGTNFKNIPAATSTKTIICGKELLKNVKSPDKLFRYIKLFIEDRKLSKDAQYHLGECYKRLRYGNTENTQDMIIACLGITEPKQIALFYELFRNILDNRIEWSDYAPMWYCINANAYKDEINFTWNNICYFPILLANLTRTQLKVLHEVKISCNDDMIFLVGAYDEIFFNYRFDVDEKVFIEKVFDKGNTISQTMKMYNARMNDGTILEHDRISLDTELRVCYVWDKVRKLLKLSPFSYDKMRFLLFLAKLYVSNQPAKKFKESNMIPKMKPKIVRSLLAFRHIKREYKGLPPDYIR
jgi:hypothetical protein